MKRKDYENDVILKTGFGKAMGTDKMLNFLYGLLMGFIADGEIQEEEKETLKRWRIAHSNELEIEYLRPLQQIIDDALLDNRLTLKETFDIATRVQQHMLDKTNFRKDTVATQLLLGICQGVFADNMIVEDELKALLQWLDTLGGDETDYTFDKVKTAIEKASLNFDSEAEKELRATLLDLVSFPKSEQGVEVDFDKKNFVLSGSFAFGKKKDVAFQIEEKGGIVVGTVSTKTNYLVVGGEKSVLWKYDNYGVKVARARELKEEGVAISIIGEGELLSALNIH